MLFICNVDAAQVFVRRLNETAHQFESTPLVGDMIQVMHETRNMRNDENETYSDTRVAYLQVYERQWVKGKLEIHINVPRKSNIYEWTQWVSFVPREEIQANAIEKLLYITKMN
jgi:hypothetical protein